jgi:hypothetical protein
MIVDSKFGKPACCTEALRQSHRKLQARLTALSEDLLDELPCGSKIVAARMALVSFVKTEIVPSATMEEAIARNADVSLQPLLRALPGRHRLLEVLVDEIEASSGAVATAAAVGALVLLCDARWDGEDEALLPALAATGTDLEPLVRANPSMRTAGQ